MRQIEVWEKQSSEWRRLISLWAEGDVRYFLISFSADDRITVAPKGECSKSWRCGKFSVEFFFIAEVLAGIESSNLVTKVPNWVKWPWSSVSGRHDNIKNPVMSPLHKRHRVKKEELLLNTKADIKHCKALQDKSNLLYWHREMYECLDYRTTDKIEKHDLGHHLFLISPLQGWARGRYLFTMCVCSEDFSFGRSPSGLPFTFPFPYEETLSTCQQPWRWYFGVTTPNLRVLVCVCMCTRVLDLCKRVRTPPPPSQI